MVCEHLFKNNKFDFKKKFNILIEDGEKLFIKYNYYTFAIAFIILFLGFKLDVYLLDLNYHYNLNNNTYNEYKSFVNNLKSLINVLFFSLILFYILTFISFLFNSFKKDKLIILDALIINLIYFIVLQIESSYLENSMYSSFYYPLIFASLMPILVFLCLEQYKVTVDSYGKIIFKSIVFSILAFFIINYKNILLSNNLINQDIKNNITLKINRIAKNKQNEIIKNLSIYLKKYHISNNNIKIYTNKSELHIIITNKKLLKGLK